jgi:hypothetical protein
LPGQVLLTSVFFGKQQAITGILTNNDHEHFHLRTVLTVSLRQQAVFIPQAALTAIQKRLGGTTPLLVANLASLGYACRSRCCWP